MAIVEKTDTGFSAYIDSLGIYTTGSSLTELTNSLKEALELSFEQKARTISTEDINLNFDLPQFFKYYRVINAKFLAKRIGMNPTLLSHYVQGRKKASQKQTNKILGGLQEIGKELSELTLT